MDRRARMHRALDAVIDRSAARDAGGESEYKEALRHRGEAEEILEHRQDYNSSVVQWAEEVMRRELWKTRPGKVTAARARDGFTARASKEAAMQSLGGFAAQYEVRKSRSNNAWSVFKIGDDFPVISWTNSKAAAMIASRCAPLP